MRSSAKKDSETEDSSLYSKKEGTPVYEISYDSMMVLFVCITALILPIIILSLPLVKEQVNLNWPKNVLDPTTLKEGLVFIATASILERLVVRESFRIVLRTSFRASGRAVFRTAIKTQSRSLMKTALDEHASNIFNVDYTSKKRRLRVDLVTLFFTWVILVLSFWIVTLLVIKRILFVEGLLLIVPVTVIFIAEQIIAWLLNVEFDFHITRDGTLIQFIFSLGSSFIPLAHDTHIHGTVKQKTLVGLSGWFALLVTSLLSLIYWLVANDLLSFWITSYCALFMLVISVPVQPLEGADTWSYHKALAVLIFCLSLLYSMLIFMIPYELSLNTMLPDFV
ncbi:MAG: hypothetical protein ACFFD4_13775 [Candidatus Odinarchaeota archaeon]